MKLPKPNSLIAGVLCAGVLLSGCSEGPPGWKQELEAHRQQVDELFRTAQSPLSPEQRASFTGLHYFEPDPTFRFETVLDPSGAGTPVQMLDTAGKARDYVVHGRLNLERDGVPFTLTVYRSDPDGHLFLPFQDATTGRETYAVGRYVELEKNREGLTVVDFNRAYNPYCAYNDNWVCPLAPAENRIPFAVTAGEKSFH